MNSGTNSTNQLQNGTVHSSNQTGGNCQNDSFLVSYLRSRNGVGRSAISNSNAASSSLYQTLQIPMAQYPPQATTTNPNQNHPGIPPKIHVYPPPAASSTQPTPSGGPLGSSSLGPYGASNINSNPATTSATQLQSSSNKVASTSQLTGYTIRVNGGVVKVSKRSLSSDKSDAATTSKKPRGRPRKATTTIPASHPAVKKNMLVPATVTSSGSLQPTSSLNFTVPTGPSTYTMRSAIQQATFMMPQNIGMPSTSHAAMASISPYIPPIHSPPIVTAAVPSPPNWLANVEDTKMSLNTYKKYVIGNDTAEYQTITDMLHPYQVTSVEQIVNHELWERFVKTRADMLKSKTDDDRILRKLGVNDLELARRLHASFNFRKDPLLIPYSDNMVLLYHCTRSQANVKNILCQGLDERLSNVSGGLLGKGIYFSDDPNKSIQYDGTGFIFIFAVLLGDCISVDHFHNKNAFVREPEKVNQQKRSYNDLFFDSIVARPAGHNEYVIYNSALAPASVASHYNSATRNLPPLAWIPPGSNYALPIQDQTTNWPFFAVDIFNAMGVQPPADDDDFKISEVSDNNEPSLPSFDDNLAALINLGYDNEDKNREIWSKFNNDLQQTVNYFLDNESVSDDVVVLVEEQPSIVIIDDDESDEQIRSPPNDTTTTIEDSKPCKNEVKIETELSGDTAEWVLEYDQITVQPYSTVEPQVKDSTVEPQVQDSTVEPQVQDSTVVPQVQDSTIELQVQGSIVEPEMEDCPICCNDYGSFDADPSSWQLLECSHRLCIHCYHKLITTRYTMSRVQHTFVKCPFCQGTNGFEIGTCPDMQMDVTINPNSCDGYAPSSTFAINYTGPSFNRTAYIPNTVEGNEALRLLKIAFDRRLCFTIGTSNTTGRHNVIVWNIHHKTAISGGVSMHGYPDAEYLDRLKWELRAFGIE